MNCFEKLNGNEFVLLSTIVAIALSQNLTDDEQNILGNFVAAVGAQILTIAARGAAFQDNNQNNNCKN